MKLMDLNTLLFAGKWIFIGLVYFILMVVVIAVRREMVSQTAGRVSGGQSVPGRLKILKAGSDRRVRPGDLLPLGLETSLGAELDNDIILRDQFVSGHHARLSWDGVAWWVEDMGSTNGTLVDGRLCVPHILQPVPNGSRLVLGEMVFELAA